MDFLRALDALPATIINTIETAPPPAQHQSSSAAPAAATSVMLADKLAVAQSIKKVRKSRVPAGVIPGVTPSPDPERWLKKSERSTFGQGRRRKGPGGGGGGATQGSASVDMASASATQPVKSSSKGKKKKWSLFRNVWFTRCKHSCNTALICFKWQDVTTCIGTFIRLNFFSIRGEAIGTHGCLHVLLEYSN